jgi:hypothetical protein
MAEEWVSRIVQQVLVKSFRAKARVFGSFFGTTEVVP